MLFSSFVFDTLDKLMYLNCNLNVIKGIKKVRNVVYNDKYPLDCKCDLYYKEGNTAKYPVLINIHGGGFVAGDKKYRLAYSKDIANEGVFVMTINYGLCPKYQFPDFIYQSASSLLWLVNNADKYNLDLDNIMVAGDSAGAYIAAYLGIIQSNAELRAKLGIDKLAANIKALILYCGPYQVEELLTKKIMLNLQAEIGSAFLNVPKESILDTSKIADIKYRDLINIPQFVNSDFPTSLLTYARCDFLCPEQAEPFMKILDTNKVKYRFHNATKKRDLHVYHLFWHSSNGRRAMKMTREFIHDVVDNKI